MRRRSRNEYLNKAYYSEKVYEANGVVSWKEPSVLFYYKNYNGKKETKEREQRVNNNALSGRTIVTQSSLPFKTDDLVTINGTEVFIEKIELESALKYGAVRERPNRNVTIITLA